MKEIVLYTTGLDSYLTDYFMKKDPRYNQRDITKVYFDLDSKYSYYEVLFLNKNYKDITIYNDCEYITLKNIEQENNFIPNRNMMLCTLAQSIYDADIIYLNGVKCDRVSDNNYIFRRSLSRTLSISADKEVSIRSILGTKEKATWCRLYTEDNNNDLQKRLNLATETYSCFKEFDIDSHIELPNTLITAFEQDNYNNYKELKDIKFPGCLNCDACFRKVCALTGANIYIDIIDPSKFKEKFIPLINNKHFQKIYPARTSSIKKYINFIDSDWEDE